MFVLSLALPSGLDILKRIMPLPRRISKPGCPSVGDAVSTVPAFSLNKYFTYGEVILAPDHAVVKRPESPSFVEAASVWMMFLTAYGAIVFHAQVKAGDFIIIPAASSSVGLAAIQIANYADATPVARTRTSQKKQWLREAGAPHVIVTQEQDMLAEVMASRKAMARALSSIPSVARTFPS
jgi:NADPH:quinone reductase-like Zn-dependent oxidoreductase